MDVPARLKIATRPVAVGQGVRRIKGIAPQYCLLDPVESMEPVDVHSYGGNILVMQVKSAIGRKVKHQDCLRSLKLGYQKGFTVLPDDRTHPQFGQVEESQHLLTFIRLPQQLPIGDFTVAISGGNVELSNHGALMEPLVSTRYENYSSPLGPGETLVMGDGEYVQVESTSGVTSTSWTSNLSSIEAASSIEQLGKSSGDGGSGFVQMIAESDSGSDIREGSAIELIKLVEMGLPVSYMSIEFGSSTFVWSGPARRVVDATKSFCEFGYVTRDLRRRDILSMVHATASPLVRVGIDIAIPKIEQLNTSK